MINFTRRNFLKTTAAGIAGIAFGKRAFGQSDDFVDLSKLTQHSDLNALEEILYKGTDHFGKYEDIKEDGPVDTDKIPSLLYILELDNIKARRKARRKYCKCDVSYISSGACSILNEQGLVITAEHVIRGLFEKAQRIALVYDPFSGIIRMPEILTYAKKDDLALLKIDLPNDHQISPTYLTRGTPEAGDYLYWVRYDVDKLTSHEQCGKIIDSIDIKSHDCFNGYWIEQTRKLEMSLDDMGAKSYANLVKILVDENDQPIIKKGKFFILDDPVNGHSGLPIFSRYYNLVSIIAEGDPNCEECVDGNEIIECVTPNKIREFMARYYTVCTGKRPKTSLTPEEEKQLQPKMQINKAMGIGISY